MPAARAELLFVGGPQESDRAVLMRNTAVAGRSSSAEIRLNEEYVSRQHFRLELTPDGWTVEAMSPAGIMINGKKFKPGKKVILDTGDVIGVGIETLILFVSPGDDPQAALGAYRAANPVQYAAKSPPPPSPKPEEPAPAPEESPKESQPSKLKAAIEDTEEADKRAKLRRYGIFGGILAAMLLMLLFVVYFHPTGEALRDVPPEYLSDDRIRVILEAQIPLKKPSYPEKAEQEATKARGYYADRTFRTGDKYLCVKSFKLYLSYKGSYDMPVDYEKQYRQVMNELVSDVQDAYRKACADEMAKRWDNATVAFSQLSRMVPELNSNDDVYRQLIQNFIDHETYARAHRRMEK